MTLYVKTGCQYCARVLAVLRAYKIPFEEKNVDDAGITQELISLGGKKQEPFLVDEDIMLYESGAVIDYLEKKYLQGDGTKKKPKIHFARDTDVCPS